MTQQSGLGLDRKEKVNIVTADTIVTSVTSVVSKHLAGPKPAIPTAPNTRILITVSTPSTTNRAQRNHGTRLRAGSGVIAAATTALIGLAAPLVAPAQADAPDLSSLEAQAAALSPLDELGRPKEDTQNRIREFAAQPWMPQELRSAILSGLAFSMGEGGDAGCSNARGPRPRLPPVLLAYCLRTVHRRPSQLCGFRHRGPRPHPDASAWRRMRAKQSSSSPQWAPRLPPRSRET